MTKELVIAGNYYGKYIGELLDFNYTRNNNYKANIKILQVLEYPTQKAILQDTVYQRNHYEFLSIHEFYFEEIEHYKGLETDFTIDFYNASVEKAIIKKIINGSINDLEKKIIKNRLDKLKEKSLFL